MAVRERVIIESPYAGATPADTEDNLFYLRCCMHDALVHRGEAPFASHGLYTQPGVLDDSIPAERTAGIEAGFLWRPVADRTAVYLDRGISRGMKYGIEHAIKLGHPLVYRAFLDPVPGKQPSFRCEITHWGEQVEIDAPGLPGGMVRAASIEEAIKALTTMNLERRR